MSFAVYSLSFLNLEMSLIINFNLLYLKRCFNTLVVGAHQVHSVLSYSTLSLIVTLF